MANARIDGRRPGEVAGLLRGQPGLQLPAFPAGAFGSGVTAPAQACADRWRAEAGASDRVIDELAKRVEAAAAPGAPAGDPAARGGAS